MAWEVYGGKAAPGSGLAGVYCLRDTVSKRCMRDGQGALITFATAETAQAGIPVAVKREKEAEVIAAPVEVKAAPAKAGK